MSIKEIDYDFDSYFQSRKKQILRRTRGSYRMMEHFEALSTCSTSKNLQNLFGIKLGWLKPNSDISLKNSLKYNRLQTGIM